MIPKHWNPYLFWIVLTEAVGGLSGWLTKEGSQAFQKTVAQPPLSPPAIVFPIVWGILYFLLGVSAARVRLRPRSSWRERGINLFITQLVLNFFWSLIFFNAQAYGLAFWWLIALLTAAAAMTAAFYKTDKSAGLLQIPYLLWLVFAAYLCFGVWLLNG